MVDLTLDKIISGSIYVFGKGRNIFVRIFWILVFILSLFGVLYYIRGAYIRWKFEGEVFKRTRIVEINETFALTICPQQFDLKVFGNLAETLERIEKGTMDEEENIKFNSYECTVLHLYDQYCTDIDKALAYGCKNQSRPQNWPEVSSILLKAYNGFERNISFGNGRSNNVLTSYGVCTTFNMNPVFTEQWMNDAYNLTKQNESSYYNTQSLLSVSIASQNKCWYVGEEKTQMMMFFGLTDDIQQEIIRVVRKMKKYRKQKIKAAFEVIIHPQDEFPTRSHFKFHVGYGVEAQINVFLQSKIAHENLQAVDIDVRKCYFDGEGNTPLFKEYSQKYCQHRCIANVMSCEPLEVPRRASTAYINGYCDASAEEEHFVEEASIIFRRCKCYPKNKHLTYDWKLSHARRSIENTSVSIQFAFKQDGVEETERFITYNLFSFIAEVGGYMGLFLGCSLLSIAEICFYLVNKIYDLRQKKSQHRQNIESAKEKIQKLTVSAEDMLKECRCNDKNFMLNVERKKLRRKVISLRKLLQKLQNEKINKNSLN